MDFFAAGHAKAQPRAKAVSFGGHARVYDPGTAKDWKTIVKTAAVENWDKEQFEGSVKVEMVFFLQRPRGHYGRNGLKATAPRFCTSRPDAENLSKAVLDALTNAQIWRDDAQVVIAHTEKRYGTDGALGAQISITEVS